MTLLLTALTPERIIQVSDRRIVLRYPSGREEPRERHVKAIITQRFACSYTGIANLGNGDTADWIATELSDHVNDQDGGIASLGEAARRALAARNAANQRLDIVCAGWIQERGSNFIKPRATIITNYSPDVGVSPEFSIVTINVKERRSSCVFPAGQPLHQQELKWVNRQAERLCQDGIATARAIAQILTECIRSVARSHDRGTYVSEDVLISSLPRPDLLSGHLVVGKLVEDYWSVTCINAGESRAERHGGPIIVGDRAAIQALPPEGQPPGAGSFCGARLVRAPQCTGSIAVILLTNPPLGQAWGWPGG